ncbi:MAG: hypothetical protein ACOYVE_10380 [Melioribacter sp.]|uniref:hypothetical protein n=1 Tax=Melioribacter sp. TaxID=2052167 RepID=UPI003BD4224C
MLKTPVLFIIFNRPDTTKKVFDKIAQVKPGKLYIAADGPRENKPEDIELCKQAREVVSKIDWDCQVFKKFNVENLGCGLNVSGAISWAFEKEEKLIILEDDTEPTIPFFYFCQELLEKYKNDKRIMHIGGTNWHPERMKDNNSYIFSRHAHIWGWATWKRAWNLYDYNLSDINEYFLKDKLKNLFKTRKERRWFIERWGSFIKTNYILKDKSNWDYQWYFTCIKNNGLCIWPTSNLVKNIGYIGTHSNIHKEKKLFNREIDENFFLEKHPSNIKIDENFDYYHFKKFFYFSLKKKIRNKIIKIMRNVFDAL